MRLGTLAFVFVLAACSSSEEPAPAAPADTGTDDASTADVATDAPTPDTSSDTATTPDDTGSTADTAPPEDAAGVKCGESVCPVGEVCCVTPGAGGSLSFACDTSCSDAGGTISCDGPEDCSSSAPICCANITITGSFPTCEFKAGDASCKSTCDSNIPTSIPSSCPSAATARACKKKGDCTEASYSECCEVSDGANTATVCVPDWMTAFGITCFD